MQFIPSPIKENTLIITDLDGTVMELLHDPACRRIDDQCNNFFKLYSKIHPFHVVASTGRDWEQVLQCNGEIAPEFPVISSNGAQLHLPNGTEITYPFNTKERDFIDESRRQMMRFKELHPQIVTEAKRFEIGFHNAPATGFESVSREIITSMAESCYAMFNKLISYAERENLPFRIEGTEITHKCLNHSKINKLVAMDMYRDNLLTLPQNDDWSKVIYMGDCLLYGNDQEIAAAVKRRGGLVIQVINGQVDRIPDEGHPAEPHMAVNSPSELGHTLMSWVANYIKRRDVKVPVPKRKSLNLSKCSRS